MATAKLCKRLKIITLESVFVVGAMIRSGQNSSPLKRCAPGCSALLREAYHAHPCIATPNMGLLLWALLYRGIYGML
jgi:hypothetical protein